jgi:hypothetical protein
MILATSKNHKKLGIYLSLRSPILQGMTCTECFVVIIVAYPNDERISIH